MLKIAVLCASVIAIGIDFRASTRYRGDRGLHQDQRAGQEDRLSPKQHQFPATARDQEFARHAANAQCHRQRADRAQKHGDKSAVESGATPGSAESCRRKETRRQIVYENGCRTRISHADEHRSIDVMRHEA